MARKKKGKEKEIIKKFKNNNPNVICWRGYVVDPGMTVCVLGDGSIIKEEEVKEVKVESGEIQIKKIDNRGD